MAAAVRSVASWPATPAVAKDSRVAARKSCNWLAACQSAKAVKPVKPRRTHTGSRTSSISFVPTFSRASGAMRPGSRFRTPHLPLRQRSLNHKSSQVIRLEDCSEQPVRTAGAWSTG
jgi:hypothetical protein